jgi:hypothetical protein
MGLARDAVLFVQLMHQPMIKHCAHLPFEPMEDPNGNIKCHFPSETSVADLFDVEDVEVTFKGFIAMPESNVDAETGFKVLSTEQDLCTNARDAVDAACTLVQEECGGSKGGSARVAIAIAIAVARARTVACTRQHSSVMLHAKRWTMQWRTRRNIVVCLTN